MLTAMEENKGHWRAYEEDNRTVEFTHPLTPPPSVETVTPLHVLDRLIGRPASLHCTPSSPKQTDAKRWRKEEEEEEREGGDLATAGGGERSEEGRMRKERSGGEGVEEGRGRRMSGIEEEEEEDAEKAEGRGEVERGGALGMDSANRRPSLRMDRSGEAVEAPLVSKGREGGEDVKVDAEAERRR